MYRPGNRRALLIASTIFAAGAFSAAAQENQGPAVQVVSPYGNVESAVPDYPDADSEGEAAALAARRKATLQPEGPGSISENSARPALLPSVPRSEKSAACPRPNALGTSRILAVNTTGGFAVGLKTYPQSLDLGEKEVVLTFDDGPLPSSTGQVLDALRAQCVKATFFLIGKNAKAHPDLVRREIADGHTIGHHSFSHPARTLRGIPEAVAKAEIIEGISAVQVASGQEPYRSGRPRVPFFRFPGFADTPPMNDMLKTRGIGIFGTDIWASDWNNMSALTQLHLVMQRLDEEGRGIILFHDTKPQTAAMLPQFLAELKAKGYRVVHIVPGSEEPTPLREAPPTWTSETKAILDRVMPRLLHAKAGDAKAKHEM